MLGSQGNSSNHYGPSSAMSRSRHQLKGHQMLPLQNASTMRAGDGCSTSGGGNGCGSGTQDAGEHAPVMELLPHRIKPTAESSSPDNNNNNDNDQNKSNHSGNHTRAGVQSPELNYSGLQTLRSYGAGPSIYDLHHNLMWATAHHQSICNYFRYDHPKPLSPVLILQDYHTSLCIFCKMPESPCSILLRC